MKKLLIALLAFTLTAPVIQAQNKSYSDIKDVYLQNVRPIIDNGVVTGYSLFYFLDKVNKKENAYSLHILDNNLKETHAVEITRPTSSVMIESSFNGENFCFSFLDQNKKTMEYLILDKQGEEVGSYKVSDVNKWEIMSLAQQSEGGSYPGLAAVPGKGFLRYGVDNKAKGTKSELVMFDNSGKKEWTASSGSGDDYKWEGAYPMQMNENTIVTMIMAKEKLMSMKFDTYILFTDVETGEQVARIESKDAKYARAPIGVSYDAGRKEYFIYGEYFLPKDNTIKDKSQGFYFATYDAKGVLQKQGYSSWTKDIATKVPMGKNGKFDDNTNVTIHKMIRTADGKIFAIGEQFKKVVSGGAVALNMLAAASGNVDSDVSNVKIELHDMMIFEFDENLKIKKVQVVDKDKTNVLLAKGMGMYGASFLAFYLKMTGDFNYAFTSVSPDAKTFNSAYVNFDKDKETGRNYLIGNIAYNKEQKITIDKIKLTTKPTWFNALPAKPGYIVIFEYFKKEKKIDIRLEKLNL
jgi:hypothetical protein